MTEDWDDDVPEPFFFANRILRHRWMDAGNCVNSAPAIDFFSESTRKNWYALTLCWGRTIPLFWDVVVLRVGECAVRERCLAYSVSEGIEEGTWGGVGEKERGKMIKEMARG